MTREQLEHIIRAAGSIANDREIIVVGSQAILGAVPNATPQLLVSMEADVYPKNHPSRWNVIDGSIGEGSPFHESFGYFAQGVDETTAVLPQGWKDRLVEVRNENTAGVTGWCLEPHDLAVSKLVAGRRKDIGFVRECLREGFVAEDTVRARIAATSLGDLQTLIEQRLTSATQPEAQ